MIQGINNRPYINLDPYIDVKGFSDLHYKICRGIVNAEYKKEGNIVKPGGFDNAYELPFKPIFRALEEYNALPPDNEIKIVGESIGGLANRDKFVQYLKLSLGAYDPYQFIFLKTEDGGWGSRFEEKPWTHDVQYFPELQSWIEKLVGPVFEHLGRIIIFKAEHDCLMALHRDLILPDETDYFDHRHEFIHLRPNTDKPFYIWDPETDSKVQVESQATFFNDQDWHSGGRTNKQTYSIRIDGPFSNEFRQRIGLSHLEHY